MLYKKARQCELLGPRWNGSLAKVDCGQYSSNFNYFYFFTLKTSFITLQSN